MMSKLPHTGVVRCPSLLAITSLASPWTSGKREGTNVQMSSVSNASVYAVAARGQEKMLLLPLIFAAMSAEAQNNETGGGGAPQTMEMER